MSAAADLVLKNPVLRMGAVYAGGGLALLLVARYALPRIIVWVGELAGGAARDTANAGARLAGQAVNAVNPLNQENVFSELLRNVGVGATGDENWTLGGTVFDWFNKPYDPNAPPTGARLVDAANKLPTPYDQRQTNAR